MQLTIANLQLQPIYTMLSALKIKGASINRARYQVVQLLDERLKTLSHDRKDLINQYAEKDSEGELIVKDNEYQVKPAKQLALNQANTELMTEPVLMTIDDYQPQFQKLYGFLDKYDGELEGMDALAFGAFLDALEKAGIK